jgi:hypothetical protein
MIEKPRHIGRKPKFLCRLCKGGHLTRLCPATVVVQEAQSLSDSPSGSESSLVSQHSNPSLVDTMVMSMQYLADTTLVLGVMHLLTMLSRILFNQRSCRCNLRPTPLLFLGSDASLDHVVSHPIQPMVEEVVMPMQSSVDPTLLLESDKSKEVTLSMQSSVNPTLLLGVMHLSTMSLAFLVLYLLNKGAFHSLRVCSLQVLGWFPLIGMIL